MTQTRQVRLMPEGDVRLVREYQPRRVEAFEVFDRTPFQGYIMGLVMVATTGATGRAPYCRCCGYQFGRHERVLALNYAWDRMNGAAGTVYLHTARCQWGAAHDDLEISLASPGITDRQANALARARAFANRRKRSQEEKLLAERCGPVTIRRVDPATLRPGKRLDA